MFFPVFSVYNLLRKATNDHFPLFFLSLCAGINGLHGGSYPYGEKWTSLTARVTLPNTAQKQKGVILYLLFTGNKSNKSNTSGNTGTKDYPQK